ncbi:MAG: hypothetical protein IJZ78_08030 [Alistipes sp.]|nr:hypothetical protein [Alistipes sp.]
MKRLFKYLCVAVMSIASLSIIGCDDKDVAIPPVDNPDDNTEQPEEPEKPKDEELPANYLKYDDEVIELRSMYYIINDADDLGLQYAMAMTPIEEVASFDEIIELEEYLFLSLGEETLFNAIDNSEGHIDVMDISSEDVVYMFVAKVGELDIVDNANGHLNITSGEVVVSLDEATYDITIKARYATVLGDVEVVATLPFEQPEVVVSDSYFRYTWQDVEVDAHVGSAYVEQTLDGVVYTICKDSVKTYVYYEDTPFLKVAVAGKSLEDDFELDVATYDGEFSIWACDPIKGMDLRVSNDNRDNRSGVVSVKDGLLTCTNLCYDDIQVDVCYVDAYRSVNECVNISYDERTELFTPRSVVLDNSGDSEYRIYVSSREGITTVKDMVNPDVVVTYPKEGWDKWLMKGNFISGSSYPDMTFKYRKSTYKKGEGDCYGMNGQIVEYDAERGLLRLNLNLYTEEGGIALYYSGAFTLVE